MNRQGTGLAYCGYIGGKWWEYCTDVAAEVAGNAYVTEFTQSDENTYPVTVGPDLTYNDARPPVGGDAFVAAVGTVFLTGSGATRPGGRVALTLRAFEDPLRDYHRVYSDPFQPRGIGSVIPATACHDLPPADARITPLTPAKPFLTLTGGPESCLEWLLLVPA